MLFINCYGQFINALSLTGIVDMKGVGLLGKTLNKENVQPDLESLDGNMEEGEGEEKEEEEQEQLGRLHFKLDYDFNKSEVSWYYGINETLLLMYFRNDYYGCECNYVLCKMRHKRARFFTRKDANGTNTVGNCEKIYATSSM